MKKIRGPKGTKVRLLILRKQGDTKNRLEVTLTRDHVKLEDEAAALHFLERDVNGEKKKIAVMELPSFYADSRRAWPFRGCRSAKKLMADARGC